MIRPQAQTCHTIPTKSTRPTYFSRPRPYHVAGLDLQIQAQRLEVDLTRPRSRSYRITVRTRPRSKPRRVESYQPNSQDPGLDFTSIHSQPFGSLCQCSACIPTGTEKINSKFQLDSRSGDDCFDYNRDCISATDAKFNVAHL